MGIPNELHSDRATENMGQRRDFQCDLKELIMQRRTSEPCPPWKNRAKNVICTIKGVRRFRKDAEVFSEYGKPRFILGHHIKAVIQA